MSIEVPFIDLTTAVVGTTGNIQLPIPGLLSVDGTQQLSNLRMFNESGCGLSIQFSDGTQEFIPAGAWPIFSVGANVSSVAWTVSYVIPNAPVAQLRCIYYYPGEPIPQNVVLGNSPIGITGSVSTGTSGNTLSNEGGIAGTGVIDIGDAALAKLWNIFTDHFTIGVDQAGVLHSILKGNASGNPAQIGQAGDISEVLGQLNVDQLLNAIGALTVAGLFTALGNAQVNGTLKSTGLITGSAGLQSQYGVPLLGIQHGITGLLGAGSNTVVTHSLGVAPTDVFCMCYSTTGQSSTFTTYNYTSTSFTIWTFDASTYKWIALAF